MQQFDKNTKEDKIKKYTDSVCEQIRWKKAHNIISEEIENHIIDQKNAYIYEGIDESAAADKAIEEMGDPVIVGTQLDRTHRPKTEWSMIILTVAALIAGLAANFFVRGNSEYIPELYYFYRSINVTVIGIVCMIVAYYIDFSIIGKYPKILLTVFVVIFIVLYMFTQPVNGARRWIEIPLLGSVSISALLLLFPALYAGIIYSMRNKGYWGIILCGIIFAVPTLVFLFTVSLTNILAYVLTCFVLLLVSIYKGWFNVKRLYGVLVVLVPTFVISFGTFFALFRKTYRMMRFTAFINPYNDPYGAGYLTIVIRNMVDGAKLFGQGELPEVYAGTVQGWLPSLFNTDYIITYLIHKVGWISFIAIMILLLAIIIRGFYLCSKQKSVLGKLVSISVLFTLSMQIIIYIAANMGYGLFAPLSLPFISYGGMSTVINLILIGIMLSVFKSGDLIRDSKMISNSHYRHKFFEYTDGKIIIDFKAR